MELVLATGPGDRGQRRPSATRWDRKNYFYPDLPKGYQISQYDLPLASAGRLTIETSDGPFTVGITRAHLEEDTAKLVHARDADGRKVSLVDFNRSGAPLMEIVTDPDIHTAEQARRYAEELQLLLRTIGASDADMERGQMRVEANVSLRPRGTEPFGTRVEVKNMNSFRIVEHAIALRDRPPGGGARRGETLRQETRGWSDDRSETYHMRSKETSDDYRYFPEPDLPPLHIDAGLAGGPPAGDARAPGGAPRALSRRPRPERLRRRGPRRRPGRERAVRGDPSGRPGARPEGRRELGHRGVPAPAQGGAGVVRRRRRVELAAIVRAVDDGTLSRAQRQGGPRGPRRRAAARRRRSSSSAASARSATPASSATAVEAAVAANPAAVADYRAGRPQAVGFLVGQVMKATRGQANAALVQAAVRARLDAEE